MIGRIAALAAIVGFCLLVITVGIENGQRTDTTAPYQGARAALQGISPNSDSVTLETQRIYWGNDEVRDEHRFAYPAYSIFIFGWLTVFPLKTAYIVWGVVQFLFAIYALHKLGLSVFFATVLLFALKEPITVPLMGQSTLWSAAWIALGLHALKTNRERHAGAAFALSCINPVLTVPITLLTLLYCGRALRTFLIAMLLWLLLSLLAFGAWIPDWIVTMFAYSGYVDFMTWLPHLVPASVPFAIAVLIGAVLQRGLFLRHLLATCAVLMLLPVTGLYQLCLLAPSMARMAKPYWIPIAAVMWIFSSQPLQLRRYEVLIIPTLFVIVSVWQTVVAPRLKPAQPPEQVHA